MKLKKILVTVIIISTMFTIPAMAGEWEGQADGRWKYLEESNYISNQWFKDTDGSWYHFDENGYMQCNQWAMDDGYWYYLGADGKLMTDSFTPDGYYVGPDGIWVAEDSKKLTTSTYSDEEMSLAALSTLYENLKDPDSLKLYYIKCMDLGYTSGAGRHIDARCSYIKYSATNSYGARVTDYFLLEVRSDGEVLTRTDPSYSLTSKTINEATNVVDMDKDSLLSKVKESFGY